MLVSLLWACAPCDPTETVAPDVVVKAAAVLYGAHVVATSENELSCAPADAARLVKQPSARIRGCPVTFSMPMAFYRIARTDAGAVKCDMQHLAHAVAQAASTAVVVCPGLHHVLMCQRDINTAAHAMVELAFVRCAPVLLSLAPLAAPVTASAVAEAIHLCTSLSLEPFSVRGRQYVWCSSDSEASALLACPLWVRGQHIACAAVSPQDSAVVMLDWMSDRHCSVSEGPPALPADELPTFVHILHDGESNHIGDDCTNGVVLFQRTVAEVLKLAGYEAASQQDVFRDHIQWLEWKYVVSSSAKSAGFLPSRSVSKDLEDCLVQRIDAGDKANRVDEVVKTECSRIVVRYRDRSPEYRARVVVALLAHDRDYIQSVYMLRSHGFRVVLVYKTGDFVRDTLLAAVDAHSAGWHDIIHAATAVGSGPVGAASSGAAASAGLAASGGSHATASGGDGGGFEALLPFTPTPQKPPVVTLSRGGGSPATSTWKSPRPPSAVRRSPHTGASAAASPAPSSASQHTVPGSRINVPIAVIKYLQKCESGVIPAVRAVSKRVLVAYSDLDHGHGEQYVELHHFNPKSPEPSDTLAAAIAALRTAVENVRVTQSIELEGVTLGKVRRDMPLKTLAKQQNVWYTSDSVTGGRESVAADALYVDCPAEWGVSRDAIKRRVQDLVGLQVFALRLLPRGAGGGSITARVMFVSGPGVAARVSAVLGSGLPASGAAFRPVRCGMEGAVTFRVAYASQDEAKARLVADAAVNL